MPPYAKTDLSTTLVLLAALLLAGCAAVGYLPGQDTVGRLRTIGLSVWVNGAPAEDGQRLNRGDRVNTGPGSSAYLFGLSNGFIQLDQNTDPIFGLSWESTADCFITVLKLLKGQVFEESGQQCATRIASPHGEWETQGTQFNLQVDGSRSVMTVQDGRVKLANPQNMELARGEQMIVTKDGVQSLKKLSEKELREVTRWRDGFPPPGPIAGPLRAGECTG